MVLSRFCCRNPVFSVQTALALFIFQYTRASNKGVEVALLAILALMSVFHIASQALVKQNARSPQKCLFCLVFHTFHKVFHLGLWKRKKKRE